MGLFPTDNIFCQTTGTYKTKKKKRIVTIKKKS